MGDMNEADMGRWIIILKPKVNKNRLYLRLRI